MKTSFLIAVLTLLFSTFYGQYYYTPNSTQSNPGGLNTDSEYPSTSASFASGWTTILPGSNVSPAWSSIETIPFTFNFNGSVVTQYKVSSSGVLTFTTTAGVVPFYANASIPDPVIPNNSIMIWGIQGVGSNDEILTKTFGNAGAQQHWIFFASYEAGGSWSYWSIVLEEGTDKIYIVDQRHSSNATPQVTAGIQIDNSTAIMVAGSPQLTNVAGTSATPSDNYYYEFIYGQQNAIDMSAVELLTYPYLKLSDAPFTIECVLNNLGTDTVNSIDINYSDGGSIVSQSISGLTIGPYETDTFSHNIPWTPTMDGSYDISVWASNINGSTDMNTLNDTVIQPLHVFSTTTQRKPMLEMFASSTSNYSVTGNTDLIAILASNPDNYSLLKYPMSWPSPGDPYFTNEGAQRRYFYNVNTVPRLILNGVTQNNPIGFTQQEFDEAYQLYSFVNLDANYSVGGQKVDVQVEINSLCNTAGIWDNLTLHAAVFEYTTYNNVSLNGEIEFYNIMKKMLPDEDGTPLPSLGSNNPAFTLSLSYDFNGSYNLPLDATTPIDHLTEHSIEDFENIGVVVWIQDDNSKYILQSATANMIANTNPLNVKSPFSLYPNPANNVLNVFHEKLSKSDSDIEIYNSLGQLVMHVENRSANGKHSIDISELESGIYTLMIKDGVELISKKFTKID